jgi:hypothetical protein
MTSTTLSFVDERQVLTGIQLMLPLHECANLAPAESAIEPLHFVGDLATVEPLNFAADPAATESVAEPLQYVVDLDAAADTLTEISCS